MNYIYPIYTEQTECQDCYKCIRQCPVKAISVENGHAKIIPEMCIMCGTCVKKCPSNAKHIRNDLGMAKQILREKNKVFVSLAPSFVSEFPNVSASYLIQALKKLGFTGVSETALGADFVSAQIAQDMEKSCKAESENKTNNGQKLFLSSACPAVVEFIKLYRPEFSKYITDRASPLLAHSRFLRNYYGDDIGIVFIGPCIAKKREADTWKTIDCSLTFNDLKRWFEEEHIKIGNLETENSAAQSNVQNNDIDFLPFKAAKGVLYPVEGGMISACKKYIKKINFNSMTISGIPQIEDALVNLHEEDLEEPLFMELLACPGGCINGPGSEKTFSTAIKRVRVLEYAKDVNEIQDFSKIIDKQPEITGTLPKLNSSFSIHTESEIQQALKSVGKISKSDELNCASCGYDTCRHFAEAMLEHRAEKTMCVSYMRKLAQKKANILIKAIPSGVVIADKNLSIIECNENFAKLLGDDVQSMYDALPGLEGAQLDKLIGFSKYFLEVMDANSPDIIEREVQNGKKIFHVLIFSIEKEDIAGAVIEDITVPQVQKRQIVNQAKKVINKHLSTVQKIAFLLGENAAESEAILNSIIESFSEDSEK